MAVSLDVATPACVIGLLAATACANLQAPDLLARWETTMVATSSTALTLEASFDGSDVTVTFENAGDAPLSVSWLAGDVTFGRAAEPGEALIPLAFTTERIAIPVQLQDLQFGDPAVEEDYPFTVPLAPRSVPVADDLRLAPGEREELVLHGRRRWEIACHILLGSEGDVPTCRLWRRSLAEVNGDGNTVDSRVGSRWYLDVRYRTDGTVTGTSTVEMRVDAANLVPGGTCGVDNGAGQFFERRPVTASGCSPPASD